MMTGKEGDEDDDDDDAAAAAAADNGEPQDSEEIIQCLCCKHIKQ